MCLFMFAIGPNQFSTTIVCWVCGSVDRTPTRRGVYGVNMQHLSCVHLSVDFRRFMLDAFMIFRALCEGRQCFMHIERRMCMCICLEGHLGCITALRFLSQVICYESVSVRDRC